MRVAFDARYLDGQGSGVGTYSLNLLLAMLEADPELELLLIRRSRRPIPALEAHAPRVRELLFPFPANSPPTRLLLGRVLAREPFELYHAPFSVAPRIRQPVVVTIHDIMWIVNPRFNSNSFFLRLVAGAFYRAALESSLEASACVLTVSEATRRAIVEHSPWYASKIHVTPNGIDRRKLHPIARADAFRQLAPILGSSSEIPFVLTIGDASPHKNHRNAVRGFMRAFGPRPEWRMVLVRRFLRVDPEMRALLREPTIRARVIALPHLPDETLNALYHAARIYLQPSYYEGFGIPILEAMAAGVPVVTSTTSCLPEVAGDAALLADPADPDAIAAALRRLADDGALVEKLRAAGARRLEHFTWAACAEKTLEAYRVTLERASGARASHTRD